MENTQFDRITQDLTSEGSRRRVLGGIVGAAAAMLTGATVLDAKKGKGKNKGKAGAKGGGGKGQGQGGGSGNGSTGAPGKNKVGVCHVDEETGLYTYKEVPPPALKGHEKHGDVPVPPETADGVAFCEDLNSEEDPEEEPVA